MERLNTIKNSLMSQVESQMGNLQCVDAEELGEVIDMIKDLEEAIYYCTITKAMNEKYPNYSNQDYSDVMGERMYYTQGGRSNGSMYAGLSNTGGMRSYTERQLPIDFRDDREGRSPKYRRMYMESKEMHNSQEQKMKDLDKYMQELSKDVTEMIEDATPEEKQALQRKIATLASKINV